MRREYQRDLDIEPCESRIVLSASTCDGEVCGTVRGAADLRATNLSEQAFLAHDNSTYAARDLGIVDHAQTLINEYVGRYDDRDVFRFEITTDASISIGISGLTADADVYLLDVDRLTVAESINAGNESESIQIDLPAGEYFVLVENYHVTSSTLYTLDLGVTLTESPDLAGDTFDTAMAVGELPEWRNFQDHVGADDTADVFQFHVEQSSNVVVELYGMDEDLDLYLFSASQNQVGISDASDQSAEQIAGWIAAGTYYVVVLPFEAASSDYVMTIQRQSGPPSGSPNIDATKPVVPPTGAPDPAAPWDPTDEAEPDLEPEVPVGEPGETPTIPNVPGAPESPTSQDDEPLPEVPYYAGAQAWSLNAVGAPEAWAAGYTGQGVIVAVIDSGIQHDHPELLHNVWINADEIPDDGIDNDGNGYIDDNRGWDFVDADNTPADGKGHGTHVSGVIAAAHDEVGSTGIAWDANVMSIRVLDNNGSGSTYDVARGIRYAVDNGADIVNLSLGGGYSSSIFSALRHANDHNVLVVVASGNDGNDKPGYPSRHSETLPNVISVGGYSSGGQLASFSNRVGETGTVQIDAPGVSIYNTLINGRYGYQSGTSMAAPHVSGVAALTLSANPNLTAAELREALVQGSVDEIEGSDSIGGVNATYVIPIALGANLVGASSISDVAPGVVETPVGAQSVYATHISFGAAAYSIRTTNLVTRERDKVEPLAIDQLARQTNDEMLSDVNGTFDELLAGLPMIGTMANAESSSDRSPVDAAFADDQFEVEPLDI